MAIGAERIDAVCRNVDGGPETAWGETVIQPPRGWLGLDLAEVWRYRELWGLLVWRDLVVRYKQTVVGAGWAVVQPLVTMAIFSLVFGKLAGLRSDGVPYPLFAFCALLPWNYFARALSGSAQSLVRSTPLITRVYFPRLILPLADVGVGLVDFGIALVVLLGLMAAYGLVRTAGIVLLPAFLLLALATALGAGVWLTALAVKYRDVTHVTPFLVQAWMWVSPVVYSSSLIPEPWRLVYGLNPMVGVIEGFRWALLSRPVEAATWSSLAATVGGWRGAWFQKAPPDWAMMAVSVAVAVLLLVAGLVYFKRAEATFADVI